jgi:alpha-galactosidase
MSKPTRSILTNREVIAVDQTSSASRASAITDGELELWFAARGGDWAMCALNRGTSPRRIELVWQDEEAADELADRQTLFKARLYRVRDLWTGADLGTTRRPLKAEVPGHDVLMVRLVRVLDANND